MGGAASSRVVDASPSVERIKKEQSRASLTRKTIVRHGSLSGTPGGPRNRGLLTGLRSLSLRSLSQGRDVNSGGGARRHCDSLHAPATEGPLSEATHDIRMLISRNEGNPELCRALSGISRLLVQGKTQSDTVDLVMRASRTSNMTGQVADWVSATLEDESTKAARDEALQREHSSKSKKRRPSIRPSMRVKVDGAYLFALNEARSQRNSVEYSKEDLEKQLAEKVDASPVTFLSRGSLLLKLERSSEALQEFDKAVDHAAQLGDEEALAVTAAAWHRKGVAFAARKEYEQATEAHVRAMRLGQPALQRPGISDFLSLTLEFAEDWDLFDVDALELASLGKPISALAAHVFGVGGGRRNSGLLGRISVGETTTEDQRSCLGRFCGVLDREYSGESRRRRRKVPGGDLVEETLLYYEHNDLIQARNANPYHNSLHGVDVMQATYLLSMQDRVFANLDDCANVAVLFAAMVHDFKHPGLNNVYVVKVAHPLANRYSDDSVLERMHLAEAFELLAKHDWLRVEGHSRRRIRALVIHSVLATDLAHSGKHIASFAGHVQANSDFNVDVAAQRSLVSVVLKAADVSHPSRLQKTHSRWSRRILREFFDQGDLERSRNVPISPLCDRLNFDLNSAQKGFIDFVTRPVFAALDEFCAKGYNSADNNTGLNPDNLHICLRNLEDNYRFWESDAQAVWDSWKQEFAEEQDADLAVDDDRPPTQPESTQPESGRQPK